MSVEYEDKIVEEFTLSGESSVQVKPAISKESNDDQMFSSSIDEMVRLINDAEKGSANEDAKCMYEMFQRIKENNGQINFSAYNKMTPSLKEQVRTTASQYGIYAIKDLQQFAKTMVMQMYNDATIDKAWAKLQQDIKEANRIPEQMDIFGSVLYDRMVCGALVKSCALKDKDPDNYNENNVFVKAANIFLHNWFFIGMMESIFINPNRAKKGEKNIKRLVDDIDDMFRKAGITIDTNTTVGVIYKHIKEKFDETAARKLLIGLSLVLYTCNDGSVYSMQTAFVLSLMNGVLAYINTDSDVQTEQGKILITNFNRYLKLYDLVVNDEIPEAVELCQSAERDKQELYDKELQRAQEKYEENIAAKLEESPDCEPEKQIS